MMSRIAQLACLTIISVWLAPADAAESMRCKSRIISDGDPKAKVAELCGQPADKERRTTYESGIPMPRVRVVENPTQISVDNELAVHNRSVIEVPVDVWVYNFGPSRLMREIIFREHRVVEINVLGRGY